MERLAGGIAIALALLALAGAARAEEYALEPALRGLGFVHAGHEGLDADYAQTMGSGACVLDHDLDGWEDLLLVNALHRDPALQAAHDPRSALYRNLEGQGFARVEGALDVSAWGMGCAVGDYDADGDPDVALNTLGGVQLFRNDRAGGFANVTAASGVAGHACGESCFGSSIAFFDADLDGDLDLYATNYVRWDGVGEPTPLLYEGQCNLFLRNVGAAFVNATVETGLGDCGNDHLGLAIADFTGDGRQDVFVASDETPDALLVARADGSFVDEAAARGVADPRGGMGVAAGDLDGDGRHDLVITHFETEGFALYRQRANGSFEDVARSAGFHEPTLPYVGWGVEWIDVDMDADQDLVIVNGHVPGIIDAPALPQPALAFRNDAGALVDATADVWGEPAPRGVSRGMAVADFDQDGYLDVVVVDNANETARVHMATGGANQWLALALDGEGAGNPDAVGAVVEVRVGETIQRREVVAQASYHSQSTRVVHVGLGNATQADAVSVRWPDGTVDELGALAANQRLRVAPHAAPVVERARPLLVAPEVVHVMRNASVVLEATALRGPTGATARIEVDGETLDGLRLERAFADLGEHRARFVLATPDGAYDSAWTTIVVANAPPTPRASVPAVADRAREVVLDASASVDADGEVVAWRWRIGETTFDGAVVSHRFDALGDALVALEVTDDAGDRATATFVVRVENLPPVARAGTDRVSNTRADLPFEDAGSADPDGRVVSWSWDFGDGTSATGPSTTHRYATLGNFEARLTVTDDDGTTASAAFRVDVRAENLAPEPRASAPATADRAHDAAFDASASRDHDGAVVSWRWDFGDGALAEGARVSYRFATLGMHRVALVVEDGEGARSTLLLPVEVVNLAPRIEPLGVGLHEGLGPATLAAFASDEDGARLAWRWRVGDADLTGPSPVFTPPAYGRYHVALEVEDEDGAVGRAEGELWVHARPVARIAAPASAHRAQPVVLDASASIDADGGIARYEWTFPDGATAEGPTVAWRAAALGPHEIRLRVSDADGFSDETSAVVEVVNLPPSLVVETPAILNVGQQGRLVASAQDADGAAIRVTWRVDGALLGEGAALAWTPEAAGERIVEALAVDADGGEAALARVLVVTDRLVVDASMLREDVPVDDAPEVLVAARLADGAPARGANATVRVVHVTTLPDGMRVETLARTMTAQTDEQGRARFRVTDVWADEARPFLPPLRPPTDACARYEVFADVAWGANDGDSLTWFRVDALQERAACDARGTQADTVSRGGL